MLIVIQGPGHERDHVDPHMSPVEKPFSLLCNNGGETPYLARAISLHSKQVMEPRCGSGTYIRFCIWAGLYQVSGAHRSGWETVPGIQLCITSSFSLARYTSSIDYGV